LRVIAWGVRARTMPITRQVTYKFVDDVSGVVFQPPKKMVFDVGEESWLAIPASDRLFAQFVAGAKAIPRGDGRKVAFGIGDQTQNSCSLRRHNGFAEIQRLRNEAHLRTSCCDPAAKSAKAADVDKLNAVFGKRPAEEATAGAAADDAAQVTVRKQVLTVSEHTHLWPATARVVDDAWSGRVITITLGGSDVKTLRPESAHEAVCCPCDAYSVSRVVEFLRARNHDGCFEPSEYHKTGRFVGVAQKRKHEDAHTEDESEGGNADTSASCT
jgi:hypothetical protein